MNIDLILSRLSNLSQVGMLLLSICGFIYVVIPIYQKEQISEDLAKLQAEYKNTTKTIEENSKEISKQKKELTSIFVQKLIFTITTQCSGVLLPPGTPLESVLNVNLEKCIRENDLKINENEIGKNDKQRIYIAISNITKELIKIQNKTKVDLIIIKSDTYSASQDNLADIDLTILNLMKSQNSTKEQIDDFIVNVKRNSAVSNRISIYQHDFNNTVLQLKKIPLLAE